MAFAMNWGRSDIIQNLPAQMREWGGDVSAANSKIFEFLELSPEVRCTTIEGGVKNRFCARRGCNPTKKEF
eukprot:scaffold457271_cov30-Prasinocladus_malaysianus.AAC.6